METGGSSNSQQQPHRYTSYERDSNGGDEAMMRRYEGGWQRFSQPDPYEGSYNLSNPQSLNRYAYVQNDPVNFIDPMGLDGQPTTIICFPGPNGPICISSWVSVNINIGGGGNIAGGGSGGSGFLNLRQRLAGASPQDTDGGLFGGNPPQETDSKDGKIQRYERCWADELDKLVKEFHPKLEEIMHSNLTSTIIATLGTGSIVSISQFRRSGIGMSFGTLGALYFWRRELLNFERDVLGPAREAAKKRCRVKAGLE